MPDYCVRVNGLQLAIGRMLISCEQFDVGRNDLLDEAVESAPASILNRFTDNVSFTADGCNHRDLTAGLSAILMGALVPMAILVFLANVSFVHFHDAHEFLELVVIHRGPNPRAHIPNGFVAGLVMKDGAFDLKCTHTLLRVQHQKSDREPSLERVLGILEHGAGSQREPDSPSSSIDDIASARHEGVYSPSRYCNADIETLPSGQRCSKRNSLQASSFGKSLSKSLSLIIWRNVAIRYLLSSVR
jgi:hypothetical protein